MVARRQLLELGLGRSAIDEPGAARARCMRLHRGVYAVGHRPLDRRGAVDGGGAGRWARRGAQPSVGGQLWGLVPRRRRLAGSDAGRGSSDAGGHRRPPLALPADEMTEVEGIPVTSASRTLFDLAAVLDAAAAGAGVERGGSAAADGPALGAGPAGAVSAATGARRRCGRCWRRRRRSGSPATSSRRRSWRFLDAHGLPRPRLNATLAVRGRFFEVDCLWADAAADRRARRRRRPRHRPGLRDRSRSATGSCSPRAGASTRVTWRQLRDEPARSPPTCAGCWRRARGQDRLRATAATSYP